MEIGVFYNWQPHNKINGSLFYAYEYASCLYRLNNKNNGKNKIHFFITSLKPLTQKDKDLIFTALNLKYIASEIEIKFSSITGSYLTSKFLTKAFFLDVKSYNELYKFLPGVKKYLYCNNKNDMKNNIQYPDNLYYWYDQYQIGNYKTKLKLYFDIHKIYPLIENETWFISSIGSTENQIQKYLPEVYVFKKHKRMLNIYKDFQKIMYIHNGNLDTNNRLIPEAMYFGKELKIKWVQEDYKNDSIFERYIDITENGINEYILDESDLIIRDLLGLV